MSANVVEYIPNPIATLTCKRRKTLFGYVVADSGPKLFTVMFDDRIGCDVASSSWCIARHLLLSLLMSAPF